VARDSNGHRVYDADVVRRLVFLTRMRLSCMPMRDLQHYVSLVDAGEHTVPKGSTCCSNIATSSAAGSVSCPLSLTATEYKIATYEGSTGPDVQALDTATGTDRTALPHEPR
jgi:hypothetical protein